MAVNKIYYKDGKKYCVPVTNKKDYFLLRDSKYNLDCVEKARKGEMLKDKNGNEKSYKTRLEQFNYSCIPNEDGTLKGAVQPANSVGMDVDFNEAEIGKIPEAVERILAKKDEIGLLMLERSATKGLHLVFKRKPELSQEENLKSVSETLNVSFDEGAKGITRVFFTPTSKDILFIDEEMFNRAPIPNPSPARGKGVDRKYPSMGEGAQREKVTTPSAPGGEEGWGEGATIFFLLLRYKYDKITMYEAVAAGEHHILGGVGLALCSPAAERVCAYGKRCEP